MNSLFANILNEIEKQWALHRTKGFLLLTLVIPVISAFILFLFKNNTGGLLVIGDNFPILMLRLFTFAIIPLFLFMTASESFSGEAGALTLKLSLVRPITRTKIFASKVVAIAAYIAVFLGVLMFSSVVSGWIVQGVDLNGALLDIFKAYILAFIPMFGIGLIAVLIAQFSNKSSSTMAFIILVYSAAKLLGFIFPQVSEWSIVSYTDWYVLWLGNEVSITKLIYLFILLLSYCMTAYFAGLMLFEKKQI